MNSLLDYSLFLTILGVLIYCCGMFYHKSSPFIASKDEIYTSGTLFFIQYIGLPVVVYSVLYVYLRNYIFYQNIIVSIADFSMILMMFFGLVFTYYFAICIDSFGKDVSHFAEGLPVYKHSFVGLLTTGVCYTVVFIASSVITVAIIGDIADNSKLIFYPVVILLLSLVLVCMAAIFDGLLSSQFRSASVITKNNSIKNGIILKHGNYLRLLSAGKIIRINDDCIYTIEENNVPYYYDVMLIIKENNENIKKWFLEKFRLD